MSAGEDACTSIDSKFLLNIQFQKSIIPYSKSIYINKKLCIMIFTKKKILNLPPVELRGYFINLGWSCFSMTKVGSRIIAYEASDFPVVHFSKR